MKANCFRWVSKVGICKVFLLNFRYSLASCGEAGMLLTTPDCPKHGLEPAKMHEERHIDKPKYLSKYVFFSVAQRILANPGSWRHGHGLVWVQELEFTPMVYSKLHASRSVP